MYGSHSNGCAYQTTVVIHHRFCCFSDYLLLLNLCIQDWLFCLCTLDSHVQIRLDLVFSPTPRGKRKVVISTNIAETSLTLEGIVYVVDSGFSKQRFYNPISDIENLVVAPISKASARQRAGRAGRVRPGKCYRLYTEEYFVNEMSAHAIPEMQRSNLVSCVIQLKALGIDNILGFDWPASPSPEAMIRALEVLYSLGVLDDDAKLTSPLGFQVAEIPLDPMISKTILSSNQLGCSEEIITIAAILSVQSIWVSARGAQRELDEAKMRFAAAEVSRWLEPETYHLVVNASISVECQGQDDLVFNSLLLWTLI
ncbi:putative pre-mRNA-splicing factor ATP-dependent RNA helicase DEAH9 [Vitis vinifera]|uniref:RNA helicase n=1 Tax=Vitis vinifera TaxID=29760 RepID=A0A438H3G2_VITVI|nr:putative pre-mRNA-splicing factor ATP-dependent RNA helicase DEAH9 [Vitis vinifera]